MNDMFMLPACMFYGLGLLAFSIGFISLASEDDEIQIPAAICAGSCLSLSVLLIVAGLLT